MGLSTSVYIFNLCEQPGSISHYYIAFLSREKKYKLLYYSVIVTLNIIILKRLMLKTPSAQNCTFSYLYIP